MRENFKEQLDKITAVPGERAESLAELVAYFRKVTDEHGRGMFVGGFNAYSLVCVLGEIEKRLNDLDEKFDELYSKRKK